MSSEQCRGDIRPARRAYHLTEAGCDVLARGNAERDRVQRFGLRVPYVLTNAGYAALAGPDASASTDQPAT